MIRSEVRALIQAAGFATDTQSVAAQDFAISAVVAEISSEREWSWLQTTATGTLTIGSENITEPTDMVVPKSFKIKTTSAAYSPLEEVTAESIDESVWTTSVPAPAAQGVPDRWAYRNNQVVIYPRPDAAYSYELTYVKEPTLDFDGTFAAGETIPFTPDQFHVVIAWGSIRWLALRARDYALYDRASAEYQRSKSQLEGQDRRGEPRYVKEWDGWVNLGI